MRCQADALALELRPQAVGLGGMNLEFRPQAVGLGEMNLELRPQAVGWELESVRRTWSVDFD